MDKNVFIEKFTGKLPKDIKSATPQQLHNALGETVMEMFADRWNDSRQQHQRSLWYPVERASLFSERLPLCPNDVRELLRALYDSGLHVLFCR